MKDNVFVKYSNMSCDKKYTFDRVIDKTRDTMRGNGLVPHEYNSDAQAKFELALIEYLKGT